MGRFVIDHTRNEYTIEGPFGAEELEARLSKATAAGTRAELLATLSRHELAEALERDSRSEFEARDDVKMLGERVAAARERAARYVAEQERLIKMWQDLADEAPEKLERLGVRVKMQREALERPDKAEPASVGRARTVAELARVAGGSDPVAAAKAIKELAGMVR